MENLSFSYEDGHSFHPVFRNFDLQIEKGEFLCIIGHSGCGKSTLLNILAGLLTPLEGEIRINGKTIDGPGTERAVVFQHYSLFPWMTARKNICFGIRQARKGTDKKEALRLADQYLRQVGMYEARDKYPFQLSGGMQQRVAIARALAVDSQFLLLDEPFGALDAKRRKELQALLLSLWSDAEEKKSVAFVTHDI